MTFAFAQFRVASCVYWATAPEPRNRSRVLSLPPSVP
jgi:hypothetical protein